MKSNSQDQAWTENNNLHLVILRIRHQGIPLHPVLYPPPRSPSGLRGQSELSEDSPKSPRTVRAVRRQSEDSPSSPSQTLFYILLGLCSDSARTLLGLC